MTYKYASMMLEKNGANPTHIIQNGSKQALYRYGMSKLNEAFRAGAGHLAITGYEPLGMINGAKVYSIPEFPNQVVEDGKGLSMLNGRIDIGSNYVWRNKMSNFPTHEVKVGIQGYIEIWDEPNDDLIMIQLKQLLANCGRFHRQVTLVKQRVLLCTQASTQVFVQSQNLGKHYWVHLLSSMSDFHIGIQLLRIHANKCALNHGLQ